MKKTNLLVVDDSPVNRKILRRMLEADNFGILEAENGEEAWKKINDKENPISLVLLDLTMPIMNGYELLERMRESGIISSIPVIVTTGSEQDNAEIKSLDSGASDFITKPYNPELVRRRVRSLLRLFDNAILLNQLEIDKLTGLYSAEFFYRHAQQEIEEHPDKEYEIVCSNIESFRVINAKYGTEVGDSLLCYIANHNKECLGEDGICGRIGADIFAVLRTKRKHRSQEEVQERLKNIIKDAPVNNFFMQYGIYTVTDRSLPISDMCDRAQMAIDSIKHKFGYCYAVYDDKFRQKLMREHQLNDYKEQALTGNQFLVYLQPKHDSKTREIAGAEALVRWNHPELGFISPGEFVPLFERNGFITNLDEYVWDIACQTLQRWQKEGKKQIPISVNASRNDFMQEDLPEVFANLVEQYEIPAEMLHIEVTESAYTDNPQQLITAVSTLRPMGFLIEMDDFGSGYSSLNMLSELPIDILKLDMRFMQQGDSAITNGKRSILSFIVSLSKWLQLPTVAEGVETDSEVDLLSAMGCNYIQGYYFAKPMPIKQFETYMLDCEKKYASNKTVPSSSNTLEDLDREDKPLVLVVEDIESNREIVCQIMREKYRVAEAENGEEAYHYIKEHSDDISCIILDLLMPVMDGFQLLELLRADGILNQIPVIITSEVGTDSELRALHLGADDFLAKPYNKELLLHHVKRAVNVCMLQQLKLEEKNIEK